MTTPSNFRGIGAVILATGTFVANDTCTKLVLADLPPMQSLMLRGIAACLWCLPIVIIMGHGRDLPKTFSLWVLLRSLSEVLAIFCFVLGLARLPIADITALVQITPFLVLVGMRLFWGERIGGLRLLLIALGIAGALLVAQPGGASASPYAIFGFLTAVGAAARDLFTRKVPSRTPAIIVTFSTLLVVMLCAALAAFAVEELGQVTFRHAWLMAIGGFFLMCGHLLIFIAYRFAPARVITPFMYSFMIWAGVSGILVFNEYPNALAVAGMGLIMLAGLAVVLLEGRTRAGDPQVKQS